MLKVLIGFLGGTFYGALYITNVPEGAIAKVATVLKVLILSLWE